MKLSTRLLLPLLATVAAVMLAFGAWAIIQREDTLLAEAERETLAYARALGLALERTSRDPDLGDMEELIDRVDREPSIYGVRVYDTSGPVLYESSPLRGGRRAPAEAVREAVARNAATASTRSAEDGEAVSVLRPLRDDEGRVTAVLEVVQPLASVAAEQARIRQRFALNTLTLLLVVTLLVTWLVRRLVSDPLERFLEAVRALGGGELSHRLAPATARGELGEVAGELNRMADRLQEARDDLVRGTEERVALERELRQSEKMAEVGRLAAGLAHEIGAPLHVIRGRADLLSRGDPGPEGRERNLRIIVEQIDRISLIVRNLLGYARRREPRQVDADLVRIAQGVVDFVEPEAERAGARLSMEAPGGAVPLRADPDLLHQVILNLVLNAVHAVEETGEEGRVRVRVRGGDGVRLVEVEDDGAGVPEDLRERIFDPFFTTKDGRRGTGLGLSVARGIVEDHGGRIEFVAREDGGRGTCVRVTLPDGIEETKRG